MSEKKSVEEEQRKAQAKVDQIQSEKNRLVQDKMKLEDQIRNETTKTSERLNQLSQNLQKELEEKTLVI